VKRGIKAVKPQVGSKMHTPDLKAYFHAQGVQVDNLTEVQDYLRQFPDILPSLTKVYDYVRNTFGDSAGLLLALYIDPEIDDRYLTLYIQPMTYTPGLMDEIEAISENCRPLLAGTTGRLLITTDFHPIG